MSLVFFAMLCLDNSDELFQIHNNAPRSIVVQFKYTDTFDVHDEKQKKIQTLTDNGSGTFKYKDGKYRLDVVTNRWESTFTVVYDGKESMVYRNNYEDRNGKYFKHVHIYDNHHDGKYREPLVLCQSLPRLLLSESVGLVKYDSIKHLQPVMYDKLFTYSVPALGGIAFEIALDRKAKIDSVNMTLNNIFFASYSFKYSGNDSLEPREFRVKMPSMSNMRTIGRDINGVFEKYETNPTVDDAEFIFNYPPGTLVYDLRKQSRKRNGEDSMLLKISESETIPFPSGSGYFSDRIEAIMGRGSNVMLIVTVTCVTFLTVIAVSLYLRHRLKVTRITRVS